MTDKIKLSKKREPVERFLCGEILSEQGRSFVFNGYKFHIVKSNGWIAVESQSGFCLPSSFVLTQNRYCSLMEYFDSCVEFLGEVKDQLDGAVKDAIKARKKGMKRQDKFNKKRLTKHLI